MPEDAVESGSDRDLAAVPKHADAAPPPGANAAAPPMRGRPAAARGYDPFLSYSHAADGALAPAIQRSLESLAKPLYQRRALRVFRDKTSLAVTPAL
jgi:hypothetical protein